MAVTAQSLHAVAHTARMLVVLADRPDHPRAAEYATAQDEYRTHWNTLSSYDRTDVAREAVQIHDMTRSRVEAAIAALEG